MSISLEEITNIAAKRISAQLFEDLFRPCPYKFKPLSPEAQLKSLESRYLHDRFDSWKDDIRAEGWDY